MPKLWMPPDIVIRPAGVWNSRSPFHDYLKVQKRVNRSYAMAVLTALRVKRDLAASEPNSIRKYFNPRVGKTTRSTPRDTSAWKSYKRSFGKIGDELRQPTLSDVAQDLEGVISAVRRATLLNHVALFESYAQCWALNHLLTRLEVGGLWTNEERLLATKLSPVHGTELAPSPAFILRCLPGISKLLRDVPPFNKHPVTHLVLHVPEPPAVNCLAAVEFWIDLRNTIVHRAGWLTRKFITRYAPLWSQLFAGDSHIPQLDYGCPVRLYHETVNSAALTLYRAALALSDHLESSSRGRRGHPWAPSPRSDSGKNGLPTSSAPLLMDNDHEYSLRWVEDESFREQFMTAYSR